MVDVEDLMIFKLREKKTVKAEEGKPSVEEQGGVEAAAPVRLPQAAKPKRTFAFFKFGKGREEEKKMPSRQPTPSEQVAAAIGMWSPAQKGQYAARTAEAQEMPVAGAEADELKSKFCEWHPWRPAYAVCNYCHRPFCYEDIVEVGKNHYCLEDMDRISDTYYEELYMKYNSVGFISAGMFMLAFLVFIYFASGQLLYLAGYAGRIGLPAFISDLNYSYATAILGFGLAAFGLFDAVLILMQSKRGYTMGFVIGLSNVALFSYQFLNSGTAYMAFISVIAFSAIVLLAYSKVSYYEVPEQSPYYNAARQMEWSNPSRF